MHPTADTNILMYSNLAGRRVMPGVRLLLRYSSLLIENAAVAGGAAVSLKHYQL